jgi:hypothetical protein
VRDQIRTDLLSSFESVRVWLFDPPAETTAALKTKLSISICSASFRSQVQELRKAMAVQLVAPTLFGGHVMTSRTLTSLIGLVVDSLNKGETVLPQSTYISMVNNEVAQIRDSLREVMLSICEEELQKVHVGDEFASLSTVLKGFNKSVDSLVAEYLKECAETVGSNKGSMW